jgi:hypothetical protein
MVHEQLAGLKDQFADQTVLHPLGMLAVIVLGAAMFLVPRRHAIFPMLAMACFISPAQRVSVVTLDFTLLRIMIVFGWVRILARGEYRQLRWQLLDTLMVAWAVCGSLAYVLQQGNFQAVIFKAGASFDSLGTYFLFRCLLRSWTDLEAVAAAIAVISVPVAAAFVIEHATRRNLFAFFGGVNEITWERDGKLRCQGAFAHAILAGCFWASLMPIVASQWWRDRRGKVLAVTGLAMSLVTVMACASSTPVVGVAAGGAAAGMFLLRHWMRPFRWGVLGLLVVMHLVMNQPIWHLIGRIDLVGGSTGFHRFQLIQGAVDHFGEWCLLGTISTAHWGRHLYDVTNQYILEGVRGGFLTLVLFVAGISVAFRQVGRARKAVDGDRYHEVLAWSLGVALFVHCMNFIAVSYFGQIIMVWYMTLAAIGSMGGFATAPAAAAAPRPVPSRPPAPAAGPYVFSPGGRVAAGEALMVGRVERTRGPVA